jgi:ribosomal protein S6
MAYDLILLLDPSADDDARAKVLRDVETRDRAGRRQRRNNQDWGQKVLAFKVRHKPEAHYHLIQFTSPADAAGDVAPLPRDQRHGAAPSPRPHARSEPAARATTPPSAPPPQRPSSRARLAGSPPSSSPRSRANSTGGARAIARVPGSGRSG